MSVSVGSSSVAIIDSSTSAASSFEPSYVGSGEGESGRELDVESVDGLDVETGVGGEVGAVAGVAVWTVGGWAAAAVGLAGGVPAGGVLSTPVRSVTGSTGVMNMYVLMVRSAL
jgi:hypothetical protein